MSWSQFCHLKTKPVLHYFHDEHISPKILTFVMHPDFFGIILLFTLFSLYSQNQYQLKAAEKMNTLKNEY